MAVALVALAACGDSKPIGPAWKGKAALAEDRGTATEHVVTALTPADPEIPAGRVLGAGKLVKQERLERGARVFRSADGAVVRVRPESPTTVVGQRAPAAGALPDEPTARAAAVAVMEAYRMDPADWTPEVKPGADFVTVWFTLRTDLPVFELPKVSAPLASFAVDAKGVRSFSLTLVTFEPRQVPIVSQREAFGKLTVAERYVSVRLVLVNDGKGLIRPAWEFETDDDELHPVLAVLTP